MQATSYQLKYCERCGSLRLRPAASAENYCQPCEQTLFNWTLPEETVQLLLRQSAHPAWHAEDEPLAQPETPNSKLETEPGRQPQPETRDLTLAPLGGRLSPPAKSPALARDLGPLPGRLQ